MIFTLSNLYIVGCAYATGFNGALERCSAVHNWSIPFVLAALPLTMRLAQSIKRYVDSHLITHLVNVSLPSCNTRQHAINLTPTLLTILGRKICFRYRRLSLLLLLETQWFVDPLGGLFFQPLTLEYRPPC